MTRPILATKLYVPPPRPGVVVRRRLLERLNEGLHRKLTLISAPAGFGKTTLVSEWLAVSERPAAWLSLDERDRDPLHVLAYVVAALQTVAPTLGEGVAAALHSSQPPTTESILTTLLNELATFREGLVLVLDDYHLVDAKPVDTALGFFLEHLPPQMHLVMTTREDPQLPLARFRVRDQLTELRAADLRFTPDEAAGFLNHVMGLQLSTEDVALLDTRTEGWIAGLQLAALSMQGLKNAGHHDLGRFIRSFTGSHRFVLDYLLEEVLEQQPESVQTFLLHSSILERLCGPLCGAVVLEPATSGQATLDHLERANLFLVPLDNERRWYRYHHLFADLLRARLTKEHPDRLPALHRRASEWCEQNGLPAEAIRHALAAEDFERAAGLMEPVWRPMDVTFQSATWLGWVRALPDALVRVRPVLSVGYAWALLNEGEFEASEARLQDAERWLAAATPDEPNAAPLDLDIPTMVVTDEGEFRILPVTVASARAYRAQALGDGPGTIRHASEALELLPDDDGLGRAIPNSLLGLAHWASGDLEAAYRSLAAGLAGFHSGGKLMAAISGTFGLADIRIAQGRLREAVRVYERALQLVREGGEPNLRGTETLYLGLSELYREQGDEDAARRFLAKSEEQGQHAVQKVYAYLWSLARARAKEAQGDLGGALEMFDEAERHQNQLHVPYVRPVAAHKVRVWLKQGKLDEADAWARERNLTVDDALSYLKEFEYMTLARVLTARYERDGAERSIREALGLLERLLNAAEAGGRTGSVIEILILQALAHSAHEGGRAALEPLARALSLAEPEGYVQTFVDGGAPMARLLSEAAAHGVTPGYVARLMSEFEAEKPGSPGEPPRLTGPYSPPLVEPLSRRELEVLRLIAQGLSNREIGERLFRALDTVKGHNRNIYGKLQVRTRAEAVERARELGLL